MVRWTAEGRRYALFPEVLTLLTLFTGTIRLDEPERRYGGLVGVEEVRPKPGRILAGSARVHPWDFSIVRWKRGEWLWAPEKDLVVVAFEELVADPWGFFALELL